MKEASGVCVSMRPRQDFRVLEVAQSSFRQAHHLFSCISDQNQKRSIEEVSLIAQDTVNEFRNLVRLLDGSEQSGCKRIRKGPLPHSHDINPVELMDSPNSVSKSPDHNFSQPNRQLFPLQSIQSTTSLIHANSIDLYREKQKTKDIVDVKTNLILGFNLSLLQPSTSFSSLDGGGRIIHHSTSEILPSQDDASIFSKSKSGVKSEEKCLASTGGCHCSKRRKLRIKKVIKVPASSTKPADIPPDDHYWRKYGQKPIKGSPYPSNVPDKAVLVLAVTGSHVCVSKIRAKLPGQVILLTNIFHSLVSKKLLQMQQYEGMPCEKTCRKKLGGSYHVSCDL